MNDTREWTDEDLEEADAFLRKAGFSGGEAAQKVANELARRAEIRLNRGMAVRYGENIYGFTEGEIAQKHDASWYEPRQTVEQWLEEVAPDM